MKDYSKYLILENATVLDALKLLNELSHDVLVLFVVDQKEQMIGTLTDGDIRRFLIKGGKLENSVALAMSKKFHFFDKRVELSKIKEFREKQIGLVPCLDVNKHVLDVVNLKINKSILPVDAVLMAGGKGVRLRPLTENTPKPLLKVGSKAIIDYNVDTLISFGVEHISVTVNYLKEQIKKHFEKERNGVKVNCVEEPEFLGTIGSIKFVEKFYNDFILVMNSDLFTNIDFESFFLHFVQHDADMSVAVVPYSVSVPYGIFELSGRNIKGIKEKPTYNYYANAGIYLIKKKLLNMIPDGISYNATDLMSALISKGMKIIRFPITGYWIDIGKHEDYAKAQEIIKHL
jgi:dTDP-glucose pyrophosphorylase